MIRADGPKVLSYVFPLIVGVQYAMVGNFCVCGTEGVLLDIFLDGFAYSTESIVGLQ